PGRDPLTDRPDGRTIRPGPLEGGGPGGAVMDAHAVVDGQHPLRGEVKLLLQVAMAVFVWTVVIGILNGADVVDFDRMVLLSHVHAGTLGWITTSVIAASLWLF